MNRTADSTLELASRLHQHLELCRELLAVVEQEAQFWRQSTQDRPLPGARAREQLLPRLSQSVDSLRACRAQWQRLAPAERSALPETAALLRQNQELIMKILVLDRENEQAMLRHGQVPPKHLPSLNRQRPHFVAGLYERNRGTPAPTQNAD